MSGPIWELCSLSLKSLMSYTCLSKGPELDFVSNLLQTIPMGNGTNAVVTETQLQCDWNRHNFFKRFTWPSNCNRRCFNWQCMSWIFFPISTYPVANVPAAVRHGGAAVAPPPAPAARAAPRSASVRAGTRARVVSAGTAAGARPWSRRGHFY